MANRDRRGSRHWHFADSGSRFANKRLTSPVIDHNPISKTFTRKIIYCKRCRNRVVSNVSHCPYCGKNLQPIYKRFWFWLIIILLIALSAAGVIYYSPGLQEPAPEQRVATRPVVVGGTDQTPIKDLSLNSTVDCSSVLVTVTDYNTELLSANNTPITTVHVQFINKSPEAVTLFLTQWQLENSAGQRIDSVPIKQSDGTDIRSDLDSTSLLPGATYTATLYFVSGEDVTAAAKVVYAPDPLMYSEDNLVTWLLPATATEQDTNAEGGGA